MNVQRSSVKEVIHQCKKFGKTIVAGGPLFTGEYDQFPEIDYFVLNEAEITLPPFLEDLSKGEPKKIYATGDYADIQTTPVPEWNLLKLSAYESMAVQFSRGCPIDCEFCNVTACSVTGRENQNRPQLLPYWRPCTVGLGRKIFLSMTTSSATKSAHKEILPRY